MSELFTKLGINWKLLVAQVVNFLILLLVLYKFAYGPILKMLEKRTGKIEKGLKDAEAAEKKLKESQKKQEEILNKARREAQDIVEKAQARSEKTKSEILAEAKNQSDKIIADAKVQIKQEKEKSVAEIKSEIGGLVVAATEKVLSEKLDEKKDMEMIESVIRRSGAKYDN